MAGRSGQQRYRRALLALLVLAGAVSCSMVGAALPGPAARAASTPSPALYVGVGATGGAGAVSGDIGVFDPADLAAGPVSTYPPLQPMSGPGGFESAVMIGPTLVGLDDGGQFLVAFNTLTGSSTTLGPYTASGQVTGMVASPDGASLYLVGTVYNGVMNQLRITELNTFTWDAVAIRDFAIYPYETDTVTVDPTTGDLWVSDISGVIVIDPSTWTSLQVLSTSASGQVAFAGSEAWVPVGSQLVELSTSDYSQMHVLLLPGPVEAAVAVPDGATVYAAVAESSGGKLHVVAVDTATGTPSDLGIVASALWGSMGPAFLAVSSDGATVFVGADASVSLSCYKGQIATVDTTTQLLTTETAVGNGCQPITALVASPPSPPPAQGYWQVASDGGIFAFGDAAFHGSMGGTRLNQPVVGLATTPGGNGYWLVASDGGVFAFGNAAFHGSMGGTPLNQPVVGMAATPDGKGYWLVASDGGIFAYGDAAFYGSMGGTPLNQPVVGMAATPDGKGYWLVASDGGIFAFGNAAFHGSMAATPPNQPVVGLAPDPATGGYWMVAGDGGVFAFDAPFFGSAHGAIAFGPVAGMAAAPGGNGYWLFTPTGQLDGFGAAGNQGSASGLPLGGPVVGMASVFGSA